jgi:divalent metal cation (Fe/Co/Zn/Cd) transporter
LRWPVVLLLVTIGYNVAEGALALLSAAQAHSLTLAAFGADSYLEVLAAVAVLWRLHYADEEAGERAEGRARRVIGATFLLLAAAVVFQSVRDLVGQASADASGLGLAVVLASLVVMPTLALAKFWAAARGKLPVLAAEAKETVACSYFSLTAAAGVVALTCFGWWWLDAMGALFLVPWLVREGLEGVRGDACFADLRPCFCRPCVFGLRGCRQRCCAPACC